MINTRKYCVLHTFLFAADQVAITESYDDAKCTISKHDWQFAIGNSLKITDYLAVGVDSVEDV